jgi:phosphoenolpyruvate carboxykinase (ATP)
VPSELLHPHLTWKDKADYEKQARKLIMRFEENFEQFKNIVQSSICSAGLHHI